MTPEPAQRPGRWAPGLPPDRRARDHRRPPHRGAGGHRRDDRLVLLPALRLAERLRRDPRSPRGGYYRIAPAADGWTPKQLYFPDTNVLITRFLTHGGVGEVQDFMPVHNAPGSVFRHRLIRRVLGVRGELTFRIEVEPRFNYGRDPHSIVFHENGVVFRSEGMSLALETSAPLTLRETGVTCEITLAAGESLTFVLERVPEDYVPRPYSEEETGEAFDRTIEYWRNWLSKSRYQGRWREVVHRSALTLKLLTYRPTGGIVAAPTTSLPEQLGGGRNWDYRYTWIRDAAFSLYALLRLGFTEEAAAFMEWMRERFRETAGRARAAPDHVRDRRPLGARGGGARPPRGLPRILARPDRKRRSGAAAARHLRRADRLRLLLQPPRLADRSRLMGRPDPRDRVDLRELGPGGRGHLGGARRAQALHLLAADVLGRARAGGEDGARPRAPRPTCPSGRGRATRSTTRSRPGAGTPSARPSCSTTTPSSSTPRCC